MLSSWEKFIKILSNEPETSYSDTVIGEIVEPPQEDKKEASIKIYGFEIKENVYFAEHLLKGYEREVDIEELEIELENLKGNIKKIKIINTGLITTAGVMEPHTHTLPQVFGSGENEIIQGSFKGKGKGRIKYNIDPLKEGDEVIIQIDRKNRAFYVIDRFKKFFKGGGS